MRMRAGILAFVVSALPLFLLGTTALAETAQIKNIAGTVVVSYDPELWRAGPRSEVIVLGCRTPVCGGEVSVCIIHEEVPDGGMTPSTYSKDLLKTLGDGLVREYSVIYDSDPEVVEPPSERIMGVNHGIAASIRARVAGVPLRFWTYYVDTVDTVVITTCVAREEEYESSKASFDHLLAGMRIPRPAQP